MLQIYDRYAAEDCVVWLPLALGLSAKTKTFVSMCDSKPRGPTTLLKKTEWRVGTPQLNPSRNTCRAVKRLMVRRCTQSEAAVTALENRVLIPDSSGKNCGFPVAMPSCRFPGIMRLMVSGSHDWRRRTRYTAAMGAMNHGVLTMSRTHLR